MSDLTRTDRIANIEKVIKSSLLNDKVHEHRKQYMDAYVIMTKGQNCGLKVTEKSLVSDTHCK